MKKMITLVLMSVMLFAFSLTASAAPSPNGSTVTEDGTLATSPKTGESDLVLLGLGTAAVVLAAGAVVAGKKAAA